MGSQWSDQHGIEGCWGWETLKDLCCCSLLGQARVELVAWDLESGGLERESQAGCLGAGGRAPQEGRLQADCHGSPPQRGQAPCCKPLGRGTPRHSLGLSLTPLLLGLPQPAERFGHSHETTGK